jgi:hypothetical protein
MRLEVSDVVAGLPATVRFTHAASGVGAVTFVPNKGDPVTLAFGESLERELPSGVFYVDTEGLPEPFTYARGYAGLVRAGDHLSLYAVVGDPAGAAVVAAWTRPVDVPSDSIRVRVVQSSAFGVVDLVGPGATLNIRPTLCYFDPMNLTDYYQRAAGDFDILLQRKYGTAGQTRLRASVPPGRSATIVITGDADPGLLILLDP